MKIRDVLAFGDDHPPQPKSTTRNMTRLIATDGHRMDRIAQTREPAPFGAIPADTDPIDGGQNDIPSALNPSAVSMVAVPTAHRRDLDFIKHQLAQLRPGTGE
jgi:hypothetical protein